MKTIWHLPLSKPAAENLRHVTSEMMLEDEQSKPDSQSVLVMKLPNQYQLCLQSLKTLSLLCLNNIILLLSPWNTKDAFLLFNYPWICEKRVFYGM